MPFETVPGLKGKVYVPRTPDGCVKKHPCKDCFSCQNCSDDRCQVCLNQHNCGRFLLSLKKAARTKTNKRNY
jgi:hypothetical protein